MARTRANYYASTVQPRLVIQGLLKCPRTLNLLLRLQAGAQTSTQLCGNCSRALSQLRKLCHLNLVRSYQIGNTVRYRACNWPPYVHAALHNGEQQAA